MKYNIDIANINTYPKELIDAIYTKSDIEIGKVLCNCNLLCFHFTRLISINDVKKKGIIKLNFDKYISYFYDVYKSRINDESNLEKFIHDLKDSSREFAERNNRISFVVGYNQHVFNDYSYYSEFFGGEYIEMISRKYNNINLNLRQIGIPCVVKFIVPVKIIKKQKFLNFDLLINRVKNNVLNNDNECMELYTYNYDIPATNILEINEL